MTIEFGIADIPKVFLLAFLELFLSADNAAILGLLTSKLPQHLRKRALFIGSLSAFFLRAGALLSLSYLLQFRSLQILGAIYLIYLSVGHFFKRSREMRPPASLWKTVILIELLDLVFAIDSMVAGIAFINGDLSKLWIVYAGGMIGLFGMRYAASYFSTLITRYPRLETAAYILVGLAGLKLLFFLGQFAVF